MQNDDQLRIRGGLYDFHHHKDLGSWNSFDFGETKAVEMATRRRPEDATDARCAGGQLVCTGCLPGEVEKKSTVWDLVPGVMRYIVI